MVDIKTTINLDEISNNLDESIIFLKKNRISTCELRLINEKNIALLSTEEIKKLERKLKKNNITPIAIASPIFKWNFSNDNYIHQNVDTFGINTQLTKEEKIKLINNIIQIARILKVKYVRIFSGLYNPKFNLHSWLYSASFQQLTDAKDINFLIENEPVCNIRKKQDIIELAKELSINKDKFNNIGIWFDIANYLEIEKKIDDDFIKLIANRIRYLHVKDFQVMNNSIYYVPVGQGNLNYLKILEKLANNLHRSDIYASIETHANSLRNKWEWSEESYLVLNSLLKFILWEDKKND